MYSLFKLKKRAGIWLLSEVCRIKVEVGGLSLVPGGWNTMLDKEQFPIKKLVIMVGSVSMEPGCTGLG